MTVTVLSGPERRRRWTIAEKLRIVEESLADGSGDCLGRLVYAAQAITPGRACTTSGIGSRSRYGADIERQLPVLSTYLGHACVRDTYWYLSACPELMQEAARHLDRWWEAKP